MSDIRQTKIAGHKVYIHTIDDDDFVPLEAVLDLVKKVQQGATQAEILEEPTQQDLAFSTEKITLNKKQYTAYVVDGVPYLNITQLAQSWNRSVGATSLVLNAIEQRLKEELETQKSKELTEAGHSNIHSERDSILRKQFGFDRKKRFISVHDIEKYFFDPEIGGAQSHGGGASG